MVAFDSCNVGLGDDEFEEFVIALIVVGIIGFAVEVSFILVIVEFESNVVLPFTGLIVESEEATVVTLIGLIVELESCVVIFVELAVESGPNVTII